jgi:hypothetical protein
MPEAGYVMISLLREEGRDDARVDRADPVAEFSSSLMRTIAVRHGPVSSIVDGVLVIQAVNGTWRYRLRDGWQDEDGPLAVLGDRLDP